MKDLSELSLNIGSLQAHYRSGSLTPSDVIREVYRRIRALPNIPIWIHLVPEEDAMRAAEALPGSASSPVFGIPFAIKDNIDAANLPTTSMFYRLSSRLYLRRVQFWLGCGGSCGTGEFCLGH